MSSRRDFMKAVVGVPVASALSKERLGAFALGAQTKTTGGQLAQLVTLEELPEINPRQSGVLRVIASPERVHKNHGWWTGLRIPITHLDDNPLKIGTKEYRHGLACHAISKLAVRLPSPGKTFAAVVGVEPAGPRSSGVFTVTVREKVAYKSDVLGGQTEGVPVHVDLDGASEFTLEVGVHGKKVEGGDGGDWADAKVTLVDGREVWLDEMLLSYPLECAPIEPGEEERLNIAPFGFVYRPDRAPGENPSETQFIKSGKTSTTPLGGILWAERRPVRLIELHFPTGHSLDPKDMILRLVGGSWWKGAVNWTEAVLPLEPLVVDCTDRRANGNALVYELEHPVLANHLSLRHKSRIENPPIPEIRVFSDSALKKMKIEIEWGLAAGQEGRRFDGRLEAYNGRIDEVSPLSGKAGVTMESKHGWHSGPEGKNRRGITAEVAYVYNDAVTHGNFKKTWWPNRTVVTVWTSSGSFSFVPRELERGEPIWVPSLGFYVAKAGSGQGGRQFAEHWAAHHEKTIRQRVREREELTLDGTLDAYFGKTRPPIPAPGDDVKDKSTLAGVNLEPGMRVDFPDHTLLAAWRLACWHVKRRCLNKNADGNRVFTDYFYGPIGEECTNVFEALDSVGCEEEITRTGFEPWFQDQGKIRRIYGWFRDMDGSLMRATGDIQEDSCNNGSGAMLYAMGRHYQLTGNREWVKSRLGNLKDACQWIVRQRQWWANMVGPKSLSCGLFPPSGTGDGDFRIDPIMTQPTQAWHYNGLKVAAKAIAEVEPQTGAAFLKEAEAHRQAARTAWEKVIGLSPVVKVRDGTYRRFTPGTPYLRGFGSELVPPSSDQGGDLAGILDGNTSMHLAFNLLSADDPRLDEALDIVEDNLFLADEDKPGDAWFSRTSNRYFYLPAQCYVAMAHLRRDDAPNFLRATFTQYACEINPEAGYVFREGPGGGNDKIQETSAFVLRIRAMLVMEDEDSDSLWLARGTPRAWLEQGKRISVKNAPSSYGAVGYEIVSDVEKDRINTTVELPSRKTPQAVLLKLRHPKAAPIKSVMVNGKPWSKFNPGKEMIELKGLNGQVAVVVNY